MHRSVSLHLSSGSPKKAPTCLLLAPGKGNCWRFFLNVYLNFTSICTFHQRHRPGNPSRSGEISDQGLRLSGAGAWLHNRTETCPDFASMLFPHPAYWDDRAELALVGRWAHQRCPRLQHDQGTQVEVETGAPVNVSQQTGDLCAGVVSLRSGWWALASVPEAKEVSERLFWAENAGNWHDYCVT